MRARTELPDSRKPNNLSRYGKLSGQNAVLWSAQALLAGSGEAMRQPRYVWDGRMIEGLWKNLL
ncbi:hypothetical protein C5S36_05620 [Candidatus Methanophagaceae archaeon]|nr:hypothetical protein C5S36_05620 [Methanophagales archaeon]